ncbi:MAG: LemA family protein [Nanoarchaeota archaeon]|nr:LemA family protein [Nanoarchaeota archaeon]
MTMTYWIILIIIAITILITIIYYNRFAVLGNRIDNSLAQIDVQLRKRADLVPNLVSSIKGYMKHEKTIITKVTEARKVLLGAKNIQDKVKAGNQLQSALKSIFALAENYPQLKANENFLQLQQELSAIEDKVAYSRQFYNDSILSFNDLCRTFPGSMFAAIFSKKSREYLKIPAESRAVPKISFD